MEAEGVPPGWYRDPAEPESRRYWDGEQWLVPDTPVAPQAQALPAPPAPAVVEQAPVAVALAPLARRLSARLIDIAAVLLLNVVVNGWFVYQYIQEVWPPIRQFVRERGADGPFEISDRAVQLNYTITFLAFALWFAYEVPAVARDGQTFGKRLLGLRVLRVDGQEIGFRAAFRRWVTMSLPTLFSVCWICGGWVLQLIDCLWCTWDRPLRQCLHDKPVGTVVVRLEPRRRTT